MDSKEMINALKIGVVPHKDVLELCVSRDFEINEFEKLLKNVMGNQSHVRFLNGEYGSGKSFFLKIIEELALKNNFVVSNISIMPYSDIRSFYIDIMNSLVSQNEGSFKEIIDNWLDELQDILSDENQDFFNHIIHEELFESIKFSNEFILAIEYYNKFRNSNEFDKASSIFSWLCGEDAIPFSKSNYVKINEVKLLQSLSYFIKLAGYSGMVILVDEAENMMIDFNNRINFYSIIKYLLELCSLNKFNSSLFVFATTPEFLVHQQKGIPSYESLDDLLKNALNTNLVDIRTLIYNLRGFDVNNLKEIARKLIIIHEEAYDWNANDKISPVLDGILSIYISEASLTGGKVIPRIFIRSFISVLDTVQQNQSFFKDSNQILKLFDEQKALKIDFDDFDYDW